MCALQFASQSEQKNIDNTTDGEVAIERIKKLNAILDQYLEN
jgi:cell division protein ZapA